MLIENPLNSSELIFPILEYIHIVGFATTVGTIAIVDLRLLDVAMKSQTPAQLLEDTRLYTLTGFVIMLFSGLSLFSSDPDMYYFNPFFLTKMVLFIGGMLFNYKIHRKVIVEGAPVSKQKLVGAISLLIWIGVVFCGIFIAFV